MAAVTLPFILGPNTGLSLTRGSGAMSITRHTKITVEEKPVTKPADLAQSGDQTEVFTKKRLVITIEGLRGLNHCYSALPAAMERITAIAFSLLDEDGAAIEDAEDFPDFVYDAADNPGGYRDFAVTEKTGSQEEGAGDFKMVITSGIANAISNAPAGP